MSSSNFKDLTNEKFGYLTVISRAENSKSGKAMWICLCKCGNTTIVPTYRLKSGSCQSCGCKKFESHNRIHGMTKTDIYKKWLQIKQRCCNKNNKTYEQYGKKGIKICKEWEDSFLNFMEWSFENGYKEGLSLDRINNSKGYSPDNCRWIEWKEQANNRTSNILITYNDKTQNLKQWCKELNIPYMFIYQRIHRDGMTFEDYI